MEEEIYSSNFPDFPYDADSVQKLGVLLRTQKIMSKEDWDDLRGETPDLSELVTKIALRQDMTPRVFAEFESTLLNVPFIKLEEMQISSEVIKLMSKEQMVEHRVIPIKIIGQELLIGSLSPGNTELPGLLTLKTPLSMRFAKVLWEELEKFLQKLADKDKPVRVPVKKGPRKRLGDILVENKYITEEAMSASIEQAKKDKQRLGAFLVKKGLISNKQLSIALSKQFDIPYYDLDEALLDPVLATLVTKKICHDQLLCPVKREDNKLIVAMTDPTDIITIDHLEMMTGMRVSPVVSSELSIISALGKLYGENIDALADQVGMPGESDADLEDLGGLSENDAPIIKLVNLILTQAVQTNISDIHIEPFEKEMRIRFRQDGVLKLHMTPSKAAQAGVVSRIKIMANLDIAETRLPQDGRIKLNLQSRKVDLRVSTIPCVWGEKVVLRLLDQGNLKVNLSDLGFEPHVLVNFMDGIKQPNGIILVTGPTGSGKTTTLYSSIFLLNNPSVNIMTAEDPVEYNLLGINQVQCHADIGLDFAASLRSFLRQDPDVIMLGEIRDFESANIAVKAAMTGHLVISTLHTNDAPTTVSRLLNMGLEPFSLSSTLRIVESQRLVRRICKACYTEYTPGKDLIKTLGITPEVIERLRLKDIDLADLKFAKGAGCSECDQSGLRGRQGIYEVLVVTPVFREMVEARARPEELRRQARSDGMLTLRESGLYKLLTMQTTVEEVVRTTMESPEEDNGHPSKSVQTSSRPQHKPDMTSKADNPPLPTVPFESSDVNIAGIRNLVEEMHSFRSVLETITKESDRRFESEILHRNLIDPLNSIRDQIKSAADGMTIDKLLPTIQAQSHIVDFNLNNIVHYFSKPLLKMQKLPVNDLVNKHILEPLKQYVITARILAGKSSIGQGLKVSTSLAPNLPMIEMDTELARIILMNIAVNALMALDKPGEIKILTRMKPLLDPAAKAKVELVVFDSGFGIPPEIQSSLFSPFSSNNGKTLGLGLAVARKLLTEMSGELLLKSIPGKNTIATIELPASV